MITNKIFKNDIKQHENFIPIENSDIEIKGYVLNPIKLLALWVAIILTLGTLGLVLFWKRDWYLKCTHSRTRLENCTKVLVKDKYGQLEVEKIFILISADDNHGANAEESTGNKKEVHFEIPISGGTFKMSNTVRLFRNKRRVYVYDPSRAVFYDLMGVWLGQGFSLATLTAYIDLNRLKNTVENRNSGSMNKNIYSRPHPPLSERQRQKRIMLFGSNNLHTPVPNFFKIMYDEVLTPFYAFQAFSVILWYNDDYWFYATCILIISVLTLIKSTLDIKLARTKLNRNLSSNAEPNLKNQESHDQTPTSASHTVQIEVYLESGYSGLATIPIVNLVPGDIIRIGSRSCTSGAGFSIPCDAVLLNGSCLVDECMLTGESVPVTKIPLPFDIEDKDGEKEKREYKKAGDFGEMADEGGLLYLRQDASLARHIIYNGTRILQIKNYQIFGGDTNKNNDYNNPNNIYESDAIRAYVVATGFGTMKGEMVTDFLYPAPSVFGFDQDSYKFVSALFGLAIAGLCYSISLKVIQKVPVKEIIIRSLDLVTIVIPPALPAAMTAGLIFAQKRLKRLYGVISLSPDKIKVSGAVDVFCFDKTGTLTEDGLDILGVRPLMIDKVEEGFKYHQNDDLSIKTDLDNVIASSSVNVLSVCCAVCHSLAIIDEKLVGDPLEIKMFIFSGWSMSDQQYLYNHRSETCSLDFSNNKNTNANDNSLLVRAIYTPPLQTSSSLNCPDKDVSLNIDPEIAELLYSDLSSRYQYGVIHTYRFLPSLQRMSVVTRRLLGQNFELYCKGAPEIVRSLCLETSIPINFDEELDALTNCGYRVIACAHKNLHHFKLTGIKKCSRTQMEKDMTFIGFLIFQNKLKPQSMPTLDILNKAGLKNVMITGDNILTALSVAKECHLIPENSTRVYIVDAISSVISNGSKNNAYPSLHITLTPRSLLPKSLTTKNDLYDDELFDGSPSTTTNNPPWFNFMKVWNYFECFNSPKLAPDMKESNKISTRFYYSHEICKRLHKILFKLTGRNRIYSTNAHDNRCREIFGNRANIKCVVNMLKENGGQGNVFVNHPNHQPFSNLINKSNNSKFVGDIEFSNEFNSNQIVYAMTGPTFKTLEKFYENKTQHQIKISLKGRVSKPKDGDLNHSSEPIIHQSLVGCDIINNFKCRNKNPDFIPMKDINNNNSQYTSNHNDATNKVTSDRVPSSHFLDRDISNDIPSTLSLGNEDLLLASNTNSPISTCQSDILEFEPDLIDRFLIDGCCVFARMTPECKTRLVQRYQRLDYYVGMCGDGANDCGALKAAHMGVSLAVSDHLPEEDIIDDGDKFSKKDKEIQANVRDPLSNNNGNEKFRGQLKRAFNCSISRNDYTHKIKDSSTGTASLAAPFTATQGNISCIPGIIKEGRASLATSFCVFKNMACYSLNQFLAVLALYWFGTNFSDVQFTFADFFPATVLTMLMGNTRANPQLPTVRARSDVSSFSHKSKAKFNPSPNGDLENMSSLKLNHIDRYKEKRRYKNYMEDLNKYKPDTSLAQALHVGSVFGHIVINSLFLAAALIYTFRQPWSHKVIVPESDFKNPYYIHVASAVFILSFFQYLIFTVVLSKGAPFRRPYYSNFPLLIITALLFLFWVYLTIGKPYSYLILDRFFELKYPPTVFPSLFYLTLALCNFGVSIFFEHILLDKCLAVYLRNRNIFLRPSKLPKYLTFASFSEEYCIGQNM
ncbi:unnamed protein product [Gordionus sp. m RMFG-2023]